MLVLLDIHTFSYTLQALTVPSRLATRLPLRHPDLSPWNLLSRQLGRLKQMEAPDSAWAQPGETWLAVSAVSRESWRWSER